MNYRRCEWQEARPCSDDVEQCTQEATTFIEDEGDFCDLHAEIVTQRIAAADQPKLVGRDAGGLCTRSSPSPAINVAHQGPVSSVSAEQRAENLPPHEASQSRPYGSAISDVQEVVEKVFKERV